jgi:CMP-N,N'-diacetyllegionaminic acid synthase
MTNIVIIAARGGSKGIPKKNLIKINGLPLIAWSIFQAKKCKSIDSVWVTSDDDEILSVASKYGANRIKRPKKISGDKASSELAWEHAVKFITLKKVKIDTIVALQPTSPIRESSDIESALNYFNKKKFDSLLSVTELEDFFVWENTKEGPLSMNYDYKKRSRRQSIEKKFLENGSFYIFKPKNLLQYKNRLGGKIGLFALEKYKSFQIDNKSDVSLCEAIMKYYKVK